MDGKSFTPEESLSLIATIIEEAHEKLKRNGHILIFWGSLIAFVSIIQFILIRHGAANETGLPALLYPLVGVPYILFHTWKERKEHPGPRTIIGRIILAMGWILGLNLMILGFLFSNRFVGSPLPVFFILIAMFIFLTGVSIRFRPLVIGGILLNVLGLAAFYVDWELHPLIMSIGSIVAILLPGILLNHDQRREDV